MNEKDKSELDIPNFGDVLVSDSNTEKEATKETKPEKNETSKDVESKKVEDTPSTKEKTEDKMQSKDKHESAKDASKNKKDEAKEDVKPMPKMQGTKKEEVKKEAPKKEVPKKAEATKSSEKTGKKTAPANHTKKPKGKKKPNYLVIASAVVLAIPCLVLLYIILSSREKQGEPVVGNRFDDALVNEISEADVTALQSALQLENTDKVSVNLKSATLRITIDTGNDASQGDVEALMNQAYDIVVEKFPVDTYFTNQTNGDKTVKMYDLEVNAYNFIPENEEQKADQIHISRTKNAAAESDVVDVLSSAKDEETSEGILHPDTSNPPTQEGDAEGE